MFYSHDIGLIRLTFYFVFNDTATTEIYTLSLHDALPIWSTSRRRERAQFQRTVGFTLQTVHALSLVRFRRAPVVRPRQRDRKSTRLNSSHVAISYAVFCLKKKKKKNKSI